jgi:predicted DNA-binding protein YlxM (UPF0122 family)
MKNNPEKQKQYMENHRQHDISTKEWNDTLNVLGHECIYCNISEEDAKKKYGQKLHKDHAYNNGSNGIDNCILACKSCNCTKHTKDWDEWFTPENPIYDEVNYNRIKAWLDSFKVVNKNII